MEEKDYIKGRGAQLNNHNPFDRHKLVQEHIEGIDEPLEEEGYTEIIEVFPKKIVNTVSSPDIPMDYSMNPYQGCEHGCIYCYARPTHHYWGYSAGLDFEQKILVKSNAPELLEKHFRNPRWKPAPIMLSGNTDCYQPVERKLKITRGLLEKCLKFQNPVGIITKNSLILRDLDLLRELNKHGLIHVVITITTLDEKLRGLMEPRTATSKKRMDVLRTFSNEGIPTMLMMAPVIPGLTSHEIPAMIEAAANAGVSGAGYTLLRLNGPLPELFADWVNQTFPERAEKILHQVAEIHGGKLGETRFGKRMRGEGKIAEQIRNLFHLAKRKYMPNRSPKPYNLEAFIRPEEGQMRLFFKSSISITANLAF